MGNWFTDFLTGGVSGVVDSIGNVVDKLTTTDEEKLQLKSKIQAELNRFSIDVMKQQTAIETEITERLKADMSSDSFLSKNIRPLTLIFILVTYFLFSTGSAWEIKVNPEYVKQLGSWGETIMYFYFGGRSLEKIIDFTRKRRESK